MKTTLQMIGWFASAILLAFFYAFMGSASPSPCLSKSEARTVYPSDHLYRHQGCWYSKRPAKPQIDLNDKRIF